MSTLKADTIQSTSGGAATLTKQQAAKHWVNYDAINEVVDGSFNQTSLDDWASGEFTSNFTNNFNSVFDRCHFTSALNSTDDGSTRHVDESRGGVISNLGHIDSNTNMTAPTTGKIDFYVGVGSTDTQIGDARDVSASYLMTIGDLA